MEEVVDIKEILEGTPRLTIGPVAWVLTHNHRLEMLPDFDTRGVRIGNTLII